MGAELVAIVERCFKAAVFVPCVALVGWWLFCGWLDKTLTFAEAAAGGLLLGGAFVLGVISIVSGGWGFMGVLGIIYVVLLTLAAWEYIYWQRREREHLLAEVQRYEAAALRDPNNAAAYSFLGRTHLKLGNADQALAALERAVELEPESPQDHFLIEQARAIRARQQARSPTHRR